MVTLVNIINGFLFAAVGLGIAGLWEKLTWRSKAPAAFLLWGSFQKLPEHTSWSLLGWQLQGTVFCIIAVAAIYWDVRRRNSQGIHW